MVLPNKFTEIVAKATTVILLKGMRIAAYTGSRFPVMANERPPILYKNEIMKAPITTDFDFRTNANKLGSR